MLVYSVKWGSKGTAAGEDQGPLQGGSPESDSERDKNQGSRPGPKGLDPDPDGIRRIQIRIRMLRARPVGCCLCSHDWGTANHQPVLTPDRHGEKNLHP